MKRIWHPWWKWECYRHGLYETTCDLADDDAANLYAYFLRDLEWFRHHAKQVTSQWKHSCEQFLSNASMNRIAWIGQASMCRATSVPRRYRYGFRLLTGQEQAEANEVARGVIEEWERETEPKRMSKNGRAKVTRRTSQTTRRTCWREKVLPPHTDQLPLRF